MNDINDLQYTRSPDGEVTLAENERVVKMKRWFREAVDAWQDWRKQAVEDLEFYDGIQWQKDDRKRLEEHGRPAITINRIRPLHNVLSGYQRLNRYDIDFLPRTNDDMAHAQLRKGITKYILDACDYDSEESDAFDDSIDTGLGWLEVGYRFDYDTDDGDAFVRRVDNMDMYVDPEARHKHFTDAKYMIRARWIDKEELKSNYPEKAEEIDAQADYYLSEEAEHFTEPRLWYQNETNKVRIAECWYKKAVKKTKYLVAGGIMVDEGNVTPEMVALGMKPKSYVTTEVHLITFFDNVVLEDMESPYKHGDFPFVPLPAYYRGGKSMPAGIIRDLKDPQREVNKRRSQELHILDNVANGGWMVEEGSMSKEQEQEFKRKVTTPGAVVKVAPGALMQNKIQPLVGTTVNPSISNATAEAQQEMVNISGINEALMGTDIPNQASGRAIELKQKQAITHIAALFDNMRRAKKQIAKLLWGTRNKPGVIPQFYTEEKTFRIVGPNGKPDYVTANEQVTTITELGETITTTLNDLSVGDFDIVVAQTPNTTTQRTAQFWSLVDACQQLGIPGDMAFDILLDISDIAQKDELKQRWQKRMDEQKAAQQAQQEVQQAQFQAQMELEREKKLSKSIAYKDLQLPLQLELAAKAGIFPQEYADAFMQWSVEQYASMLGIPAQAPALTQQSIPQGVPPVVPPEMMQPAMQQPPTQARPMTQAMQNGMAEANRPAL